MKKVLKGYTDKGSMKKMFVLIILVSIVSTLPFVLWKRYAASKERHGQRPRVLVDTEGCRIVSIDVDPKSIFYVKEPNRSCRKGEARALVVAGDDPLTPSLHLNKQVLFRYGDNLKCAYSAVLRVDDFTSKITANVTFLIDEDTPVEDEFLRVVCTQDNRLVYDSVVPVVQRKKDVEERCRKRKEAETPGVDDKLSVLFLILDSVSRGHFLRQMKKTDSYLRRHVNMVDMQGFTKVGTGTFSVLTALLTGKFWSHWKDTLNLTYSSKVDALPFVWKDFAERGYRVLYSEDMAPYSAFSFAVGGFATQPTDYYFRTLGLHYEHAKLVPCPCNRGRAEARMILKWTRDFLTVFAGEPVFAFTKLGYLSHDYLGTLHLYDDLVLNFFRALDADNHLNRSIVFFMADHGFRFGKERSTLVGREESKLPLLFVMFPRWFASKYPAYASNLKTNANRLVTVFDIHETLLDILRLAKADLKEKRSKTNASHVGLFTSEVSSKRTCAHALIRQKFCPCSETRWLPLKSQWVNRVARELVAAINNFTVRYRSLCRRLRLHNVTYATVQSAGDERQFLLYEVIVKVYPGPGMFEATVLYARKDKAFVVHQEEVERINRYDHQGDCMADGALRPFCYCRRQPTSKP